VALTITAAGGPPQARTVAAAPAVEAVPRGARVSARFELAGRVPQTLEVAADADRVLLARLLPRPVAAPVTAAPAIPSEAAPATEAIDDLK
jgi:hypothetical protein